MGMKADIITTPKEWDRLCDLNQAPLSQRWLYGAAAKRLGRNVRRLAIYDDGICVGTVQMINRTIAGVEFNLATRGPCFLTEGNYRFVLKCIKRALPALSLTILTPAQKIRRFPLSRAVTLCDIDLALPTDILRQNMHVKWRNGLKKAEKARTKVAQITTMPAALMPLLQAEKKRQSTAKYHAIPPEFTLALQEVAPKSLRLFTATDAQMLFITHGNSATYHIGHTGPEGRAHNAHNLILWHAMQVLKNEGITRLDLGTIDQGRAPDLARFKLRSGARRVQIPPASLL